MRTRTIILLIFITATSSFSQALKTGDKAPQIIMNSVDGKQIKLSDLEGKIVLIDFWAAWCAPCRKENPILVNTFQKYKDEEFKDGQGFTVFSISLDNNAEAWKKAIAKDGLVWPYHVSDLKGWNSQPAKLYHINQIPYNFLIDGNGIIIAMNLRGEKLEYELRKLKKRNRTLF